MEQQLTTVKRKKTSEQALRAAEAATRTYHQQRRLNVLKQVAGYLVILFVASIFGMMLAGDRFSLILSALGLSAFNNRETGVYADCSDPANASNAYCERSAPSSQKSWDSMRKSGKSYQPFSLH